MNPGTRDSPAGTVRPGSEGEATLSTLKDSDSSVPDNTGENQPSPPEAEAILLYWASSIGRDEYHCPRYHLNVEVRCPYCQKKHTHGLGLGDGQTPTSDSGGHRLPHCGPRVSSSLNTSAGYYITGLNRLTVDEYPAARCRQLRAAAQQVTP